MGCVAARPGTGLKALAKRDRQARERREVTQRFAAILGFAIGFVGTIPTSVLDTLKADKLFAKTKDFLPYVTSVLRLHGYEVESTDAGLRYAIHRRAA